MTPRKITADSQPMDGGNAMNDRDEAIRASVAAYPAASWWKRLPLIRHARAIFAIHMVNQHYDMCQSLGMLPVNSDYDYAIVDAIWRGEK